jgi:hypothetical protein
VSAAVFAASFAALYAGHQVGDIWAQRDWQALSKGLPGWHGRLACAEHVAVLTACLAACLGALIAVTGMRPDPVAVLAALAVNAVSHYAADRRRPLAALAERLGKGPLYRIGQPRPGHDDNPTLGTGAFQLDQAFHIAWLFVAALIIAA